MSLLHSSGFVLFFLFAALVVSDPHSYVDRPNTVASSFDLILHTRACALHQDAVKPFEEIPGPKPLPIIGNIWRYIPPFGDLDITKMHLNALKMRKRYGSLVLEKVIADRIVVHVFDPQDMETVFRNEGRCPTRLSHRALLRYRQQRPEQYRNGGLFPSSNGADWAEMRTKFQVPLMRQNHMEMYRNHLHDVSEDLIDTCSRMELLDGKKDLSPVLYRWALESTGVIALDSRLGCLRYPMDDSASARPRRLVEAIAETLNVTMLTENGLQFWRYWDTPTYQKLVKAQDSMAEYRIFFTYKRSTSAVQQNVKCQ
ncbi:hypothetical protein BIW11_07765 [Tropilaelaps mercedesae]|uniref:Uncharacterized protein n=1 Tax=Tropilaelaps mercedesae TaxID=418985 RepID=A0A1V9XSU3_9ACAR|nr:hypothetical protein BIW11_07765 [Tropilaelaps mercedesae]